MGDSSIILDEDIVLSTWRHVAVGKVVTSRKRSREHTTLLESLTTSSCNFLYSEDAIKECKDFFNSTRCYVGTDGKFINSLEIDTIKYVLQNLTGDPQ